MDINNFSREEIVAIDRISKHGELQAMDKVEIVGLTSEKGRHLNGRIAIVNGIDSDEKKMVIVIHTWQNKKMGDIKSLWNLMKPKARRYAPELINLQASSNPIH